MALQLVDSVQVTATANTTVSFTLGAVQEDFKGTEVTFYVYF